ncbi:MAG: 30S ribosomal protein S9 [Deltaproteobacteria bacterium]|nr:30S ribosomal protein S9 [Deltaproteobacteria bacterium]
MALKYLQSVVGKRKTAIARAYIKKGTGKISINNRSLESYYIRPISRMMIMQPLELTDNVGKFDINVNVRGGGLSGQAGAIRHAISRALSRMDEGHHKVLKKAGLLTRDARKKERKLPGQPGARKRYQFSKR